MRLAVAACFALLAAPLASAQTTYGLRAGLNATIVRGFDLPEGGERESKLGLAAGVLVRHALSAVVGAQGELGYSRRGGRVVFPDGSDVDLTYDLHYVESSLLLRLSPPVQSALSVGAIVGPTFGIAVEETVSVGEQPLPQSVLTAADLGISVGADIGVGPVGLDLRYTRGLWDINRGGADISDPEVDPDEIKNAGFSATVQYHFGG